MSGTGFGLDLERIDEYLAGLAAAATDAELRNLFATYHSDAVPEMPPDPFADEYRSRVLAMYEHLSGRSYAPSNEVTVFDVEHAAIRPFPFGLGSLGVIGDHLMVLGQLVRALGDLPPGASVLDCGVGWGNSSVVLAKAGMRVTAIEVEPRFVELVERRAVLDSVEIETIHADFLTGFERLAAEGRTFDAVVFFESFHHCDDPARLIGLIDRVVAPGGSAVFASEPITDDFPLPWGLRLDGESLWAIRTNGWFELGFRTQFFDDLLRRHGWVTTRHSMLRAHDAGDVHVARRARELVFTRHFGNGLLSAVGDRSAGGATTTQRAGFLVFGPYAPIPHGGWRFEVLHDPAVAAPSGRITVDVVHGGGQRLLARRLLDITPATTIGLDVDVPRDVTDLEVRVAVEASTVLHVTGVRGHLLEGAVVNRIDPALGVEGRSASRWLGRLRR